MAPETHELLLEALADARTHLPDGHPDWVRVARAYATGCAHGMAPRVAARWAVVRVTQVVPLYARAKRA